MMADVGHQLMKRECDILVPGCHTEMIGLIGGRATADWR
jgi:hypothetical protein